MLKTHTGTHTRSMTGTEGMASFITRLSGPVWLQSRLEHMREKRENEKMGGGSRRQ